MPEVRVGYQFYIAVSEIVTTGKNELDYVAHALLTEHRPFEA